MADLKISQLPTDTPTAAAVLPFVEGGANKKAALTAFLAVLVDSAPGTLDTLNELAAALGDDPNFSATVATQLGLKANDSSVVHIAGTETVTGAKTFSSTVSISGAATLTSTLSVTSLATFLGDVAIGGVPSTQGTIRGPNGLSIFQRNSGNSGNQLLLSASAAGDISIGPASVGTTTINSSAFSVSGTATVSGATTLSSTLAVTGAVTMASSVTVAAGSGGTIAKVGGTIFDHSTDAGNTTTSETDLYSDTLPASLFNTNNHKVSATYDGIFAANTTTKQIRVYFGGTLVYDSGALALLANLTTWTVKVRAIRVSSSVVRVAVDFNGAALTPPAYIEVTGLTLTNTQVLKITGQAGSGGANNDIVAKMGTVRFDPAA